MCVGVCVCGALMYAVRCIVCADISMHRSLMHAVFACCSERRVDCVDIHVSHMGGQDSPTGPPRQVRILGILRVHALSQNTISVLVVLKVNSTHWRS